MYRSDIFEEIGHKAGFEYNSNQKTEGFRKNELKQICEYFNLETSGSVKQIKQRLIDHLDLNFEIKSYATPRSFNKTEVKTILTKMQKNTTR